MSEETKRGAPTEDGWYVVHFRSGHDCIVLKEGCNVFASYGGTVDATAITMHRKHVPLTVPPLKELSLCVGKPCVVLVGDRPALAEKFQWSNDVTYLVHQPNTHWAPDKYGCNGCKLTELTRAECEAAGYAWPLENTP